MLLLAVPWGWAVSPALMVAPIVPVAYLAWRYWSGNLTAILLAAVAAAVLVLGLSTLAQVAVSHVAHLSAPPIDSRLAEATWSSFTQRSSTNGIAAWVMRIPTWTGLALLLFMSVRLLLARRPQLALATESL
jgi:hypothetical protein